MKRKFKTMDANEAVANIAYRVNEIIAIYPITPSSTMGEWADQWSSEPDFTCHYEGNNMWRCWVGFNASHSMGLILFGLVFGYLALAHGQLLFQSPFLLVVGLAMLGGFVVLCKFIFLVCLSQASAFLWPAMSQALRYRGSNNALHSTPRASAFPWVAVGRAWALRL